MLAASALKDGHMWTQIVKRLLALTTTANLQTDFIPGALSNPQPAPQDLHAWDPQ